MSSHSVFGDYYIVGTINLAWKEADFIMEAVTFFNLINTVMTFS